MQLVIRDVNQGPFLTQVLRFGRENERLSDQQLAAIKGKAGLMSLKFADKYYNKYKMHLLEQAAHDVIGVVSLGLLELSQRDTDRALALLQAPEGPIKPFQKGWSMLISVSTGGNSLYGEVDARLLDKISSPPDVEEWQGWQEYEKAQVEHNKVRLMSLIDQHFFACENDHPTMEDKLAEALLYRILCGNGSGAAPLKVKQDLKRKLAREI
ncbi:MAG: cold adaptation protein AtcC, partial [Aeromonas veronii]